MKLLCVLLFGIGFTAGLQGQNCGALDSKSFFNSVKFGDQIPKDLIACSKNYRREYDSLSNSCKKKYADLFTFLLVPFSFSEITANNKGQIYAVEMFAFFDDNRSKNSVPYEPSANFLNIYNKLKSLYGKPARVVAANNTDSLFVKELGMPRFVEWECDKITLQLRVRYGSRAKELNVIDVRITNRDFEAAPEEQILQQLL